MLYFRADSYNNPGAGLGGGTSRQGAWINASEVTAAINSLKSAHDSLVDEIYNVMYTNFASPVAEEWITPNSKTFFDNMKNDVNKLLSNIKTTTDSVIKAMADNATALLSAGGSTDTVNVVSLAELTFPDVTVDFEGKTQGMNYPDVSEKAKALTDQMQGMESSFTKLKTALTTCGFYGSQMDVNLGDSIAKIESSFKTSTNDIAANLSSALADDAKDYGELASTIASNLTAEESGSAGSTSAS